MVALSKLRPLFRTRGWAILAVFVSGLFFVTLAHAQMPASLSVQAERTGSGITSEALYELHIGAGEEGAAFGFEYELPRWPGSETVVGSPLVVTSVIMTGPGTIRPATPGPVLKPSLKRAKVCLRGRSSRFGRAFWVEVPANGTAVIQVKGRASYASWPETQYRVRFSVFEMDSPTAMRNPLQAATTLPLGTKGVHISIRARHKGMRREEGLSPEIVGRTEPALKFAHIMLRAVRPTLSGSVGISQWNRQSSVVLGSVRTNSEGQFRLAPRGFPFVGEYAILARSRAQAGLVADWNCGPFF
jgi:hypothetical protein